MGTAQQPAWSLQVFFIQVCWHKFPGLVARGLQGLSGRGLGCPVPATAYPPWAKAEPKGGVCGALEQPEEPELLPWEYLSNGSNWIMDQ